MNDVKVRAAVPADAPAIAAVHVASWQGAYVGLMEQAVLDSLDVGQFTERRQQHLDSPRPGVHHFVAEQGGVIVGFTVVGPTRDAGADTATTGEIYAMYAHPTAWGTGAGRELMRAGLACLRDCDFTEATLWVLEGNTRGRRFYENAGLIPDGGTKTDTMGLSQVRYRMAL